MTIINAVPATLTARAIPSAGKPKVIIEVPMPPKEGLISIYDANETNFDHNGLVVLNESLSCYTTEELNGVYEIELVYPIDDAGKWKYLIEHNIIRNSDGQLFRIFHRVKTLDKITIYANHIFYDLAGNYIESASAENLDGAGALDAVLNNTAYDHPFGGLSDVNEVATQNFLKVNPVEAIMGDNFSILKTWGGELQRDNYRIKILNSRGADRGVVVSYEKNIIGMEETVDISELATRIIPTGKDGLTLPAKYTDSPYINNYPFPYIKPVEFRTIETIADLQAQAEKLFTIEKLDVPVLNYKIDFVELSKTEEYKNYNVLESVNMGDTVTVNHTRLGISIKLKVIRIKKNDITGRIEEIEIGAFKQTLSKAINKTVDNKTDTWKDGSNGSDGGTGGGGGGTYPEIHPKLYTSHSDPDPAVGIDGDVWIKY